MRIGNFFRKNYRVIFGIGEIALTTLALYQSVRNTQKYIEERSYDQNEEQEPREKAVKLAKTYAPTIIAYSALIGLQCFDIYYSKKVKSDYLKALFAASVASQGYSRASDHSLPVNNAQNDEKVGKTVPPEEYYYKVFFGDDEIPEEIEMANGADHYSSYFYIPPYGRMFVTDMNIVEQSESLLNYKLEHKGKAYLNDIFGWLGLERTSYGADLVWTMTGDHGLIDNCVEFDISPGMAISDNQLFYVLNFSEMPHPEGLK